MTNEEMLGVADIVERATNRFNAQAALIASMKADHEAKMVEHRAAFGARTEADAKIIAGLRSEIDAARMAVLERDSLISERDGLLTQVQDMRAEMQRLSAQLDWERAEIKRLQWENLTMHKDAEDGYAEAIKVLGDPIALSKERDALRAEVAALQERLRASIARGDFAQMEVAALRSQTPKHPVKVGTWVRRTKLPGDQSPVGIVKQVTEIRCYGRSYAFADGDFWSVDNCEPCTHQHPAQDGHWVRRTVASGTEPVGTMIQVQRSRTLHSEYVTRGGRVVPWAHCEPCDQPATHDTEAGKAAAGAALKTEPVAEEIKVGDIIEVVSNTGLNTWLADVGSFGTVASIETLEDSLSVRLKDVPDKKNVCGGYVSICDVRKVTT